MVAVAVIGLGAMGGAVAQRLVQAGQDVTGFDISQAAVDRLVAANGQAFTNFDAVEDADIIITSLPNDEIVMAVLDNEVIKRLQPHQTFVEISTLLPQTMYTIVSKLTGKVREIVDAPVTGGPNEARNGKLGMFVGVQGGILQTPTQDVLSQLGTLSVVGKPGDGKALKLVNNSMSLGNIAVAVEAFQLGTSLGLDRQAMYDVLCKSGGSSTMFNKRIPYALASDYAARFAVYLAEKDSRLALETARRQNMATPVLSLVHQQCLAAVGKGLGDQDVIALLKLYE